MDEIKYMITPSELNVKDLLEFLCKYCRFDDVMRLYRMLKFQIEVNNEN